MRRRSAIKARGKEGPAAEQRQIGREQERYCDTNMGFYGSGDRKSEVYGAIDDRGQSGGNRPFFIRVRFYG